MFIKRYETTDLGRMILMLSLEGFQVILPFLPLHLDDPEAFQRMCFAATEDVPAAYYDTDAIGWHDFPELIGKNFADKNIYDIAKPDRNRVLHWLENGNPCSLHSFPHREFWCEATTWVATYDQINDQVSGTDLNIIKDFAIAVRNEKLDPDYKAIKEKIAAGPESYFDTWQKTKFHINIIPGALISQPFISLNWMRWAHIVKKHTDAYIEKGGDPKVLERMVMLYVDQKYEVGTKSRAYVQKYIDDTEAFKIKNLWSDRFLEETA